MTCDELNTCIKKYIANDKTGTAMMLTAPWGFGKSYYIQNSLIPFLDKVGYKCVIVSLYGINDVQEISKHIYLSLRTIKILQYGNNKSEIVETGKAVGKTIGKTLLNFITSKAGLDIAGFDEKAFQQVYESIDLTGKLIVLEDIERSKINATDILGYVNNLTEHDHARVLLVANEDELIKIESKTDSQTIYSDETQVYLKFKEKTIGDTVGLSENQKDAITNILSEFKQLSKEFSSQQIVSQFGKMNLRTLKYACQKSNELLSFLDDIEFDNQNHLRQFRQSVFFGVLRQSILLSKNFDQARKWTEGKYYLIEKDESQIRFLNPTYQVYLLFKFCFDYLINHSTPSAEFIKETYMAYCRFCLYETNQTAEDPDLSVLKSFHVCTEAEVKKAVLNVEKRLKDENDIPYTAYGDMSRILIRIKYGLEIPIDGCKQCLVNNLKGKSKDVDAEALFVFDVDEKNTDMQKEYLELKTEMLSALREHENSHAFGFDYQPENIRTLEMNLISQNIHENFVSKLDLEKMKTMILKSSAKQIDDLRGLFFAVYRNTVSGDHNIYYRITKDDRDVMSELIAFLSENEFDYFDKVQMYQVDMLKNNLLDMVNATSAF